MAILHQQQSDSGMMGSCTIEQRKVKTSQSQAIAINQHLKAVDEQVVFVDDSLSSYQDNAFDIATWRMYNLIVEYRTQHPISPFYYCESSCSASEATLTHNQDNGINTTYLDCSLQCLYQSSVQKVLIAADQYDGEVFEMDS
jgi:hypothetical protein